jgi:glycerol-3-phosphate dehydrogenase
VGTTDEEVASGEVLDVTRDEVDYLLRHLNRYFSVQYTVADIVSVFAGTRPLVRAKGSRETKKLIRAHEVEVDKGSGLVSILGGKWTTYRAMAEDTIDAVGAELGNSTPSKTRDLRLAGGEGYTAEHWRLLASVYGLREVTGRHLAEKFGNEAEAVLALTIEDSKLKSPIVAASAPILAEVVYCVRSEMAVTIEDVLARRLGLQMFDWEMAVAATPAVGEILAGEQGWSADQKVHAIQDYTSKIGRQKQVLTSSHDS